MATHSPHSTMVSLLVLAVSLSLCMMAVSSPVKEGEIPSETFVIQWETQPNLGLLARPGQVVEVGDFLHFQFSKHSKKGPHSVLQVTEENLKKCNGSGAIRKYKYEDHLGGVKIKLNHVGAHHYMCDRHCRAGTGQVLTVMVVPKPGSTPNPHQHLHAPAPAPGIMPAPSPHSPAPAPGPNGKVPIIGKLNELPIKK